MFDNSRTNLASVHDEMPIPPKRRGLTLVELVVVIGIIGLVIAFFWPAQRRSREAARRSQCKNNLKQIGLALHQYHEAHGAYPPAFTVDAQGNRLHSWRTLILPYMDQALLFQKIDLSKPWDDPANAEALQAKIPSYECPNSASPAGFTRYLAIVGEGFSFPGAKSIRISDIVDGTSLTLMVIEVDTDHAVHWMSPMDADENIVLGLEPKQSNLAHSGGMHVLFFDGTVRFLMANLPGDTRRALMTVAGQDKVGDW